MSARPTKSCVGLCQSNRYFAASRFVVAVHHFKIKQNSLYLTTANESSERTATEPNRTEPLIRTDSAESEPNLSNEPLLFATILRMWLAAGLKFKLFSYFFCETQMIVNTTNISGMSIVLKMKTNQIQDG